MRQTESKEGTRCTLNVSPNLVAPCTAEFEFGEDKEVELQRHFHSRRETPLNSLSTLRTVRLTRSPVLGSVLPI